MDFISMSCDDFVEALASKDPVPGGGGASALVGALGIALGNMVGNLTVGKKKYAAVEARMYKLMAEADLVREQLLSLVERDAEVFQPLAEAYGLPHSTPEEQERKDRVMEAALKAACDVPVRIMETVCRAIDLIAAGRVRIEGRRTRILDDLAGAAAVIAGADALELAQRRVLYGADLAGAAAVRTGLLAGALLRAGAAAGIAGAVLRQPDLLLAAEHRFVERDVHALLDIRTAPRTVPRLPAATEAAKTTAEHVEDVLKPAEAGRIEAAEAASAAVGGIGIDAGEAEAVVFFFFIGVRQDRIGLVDLLELLLRTLVAGVSVRMILHGHLAEGRFDLIFRSALFQS